MSNQDLCHILVRGLTSSDEKLILQVLEKDDENDIKEIINLLPVKHVKRFLIELGNILSKNLSVNHLQWLQHTLALKFSVVTSMTDGRSVVIPLLSFLQDKSDPVYYMKMQGLHGKLALLNELRKARVKQPTS